MAGRPFQIIRGSRRLTPKTNLSSGKREKGREKNEEKVRKDTGKPTLSMQADGKNDALVCQMRYPQTVYFDPVSESFQSKISNAQHQIKL